MGRAGSDGGRTTVIQSLACDNPAYGPMPEGMSRLLPWQQRHPSKAGSARSGLTRQVGGGHVAPFTSGALLHVLKIGDDPMGSCLKSGQPAARRR
jgi:hypothetical protein